MPQSEGTEKKSRVAVLASGRGSNFQAILDAIRSGFLPVRCVALITDNPGAYAITRAKENGIPVRVVDFAAFPGKAEYEAALLPAMEVVDADLYVLAGYMRILGTGIVSRFPGRLINIHPALLPAFPGLHAQRQAVEYGVKVSGCTVHFVNEEMDAGPVILQRCVPVRDGDTEETLADRILEEEHRCLPEAIRLFCEGQIACAGRQVRIRERQG
jgi:phosphoribosylglycinamide formyltransferase-1